MKVFHKSWTYSPQKSCSNDLSTRGEGKYWSTISYWIILPLKESFWSGL